MSEYVHNDLEFKYTPEQQERIRYLLATEKNDLLADNVGAYHGASWQALEILIRTGKLPGRPMEETAGPKGALHFYPRTSLMLKAVHDELGDDPFMNDDFFIQRAIGYAEIASRDQLFVQKAGLDYTNPNHWSLVGEFGDCSQEEVLDTLNSGLGKSDHFQSLLRDAGLQDREKLLRICREVSEGMEDSKGLVLGFDKAIFSKYEVKQGDEFWDAYIFVPEGLNLESCVCLKPLGKYENDRLGVLKDQLT